MSFQWLLAEAQEAPEQPVEFSHSIHAGDNGIPCLYCHSYARRSTVAGIPSVARCMGCHKITANDKPEIQKLASYWQEGKPVEWIRIYDIEDFVYFSHKRHFRKGIDCSTCHGMVEEMERIYKVQDFTMGFCLDCHREREASLDCLTCHK
ncbi:MAG: cytochrome c3 family protein [Candidatus Glassbacteria bacterium]